MNAIIETKDLTKRFGDVTAVDSVTLAVNEGEIFGLVGLNGAGKTTTLLMLASLLNPDSGSASVCGYDIVREKDGVRQSIGLVFEEQAVDIYLTGRQNLEFSAMMYSLPKQAREERVANLLNTVGLADYADVKVKDYSGGMLRRLEIARGMLTQPKVLFLDEPTVGVDVQTRRYLWDYVKHAREAGMTVLLATSYLEEADYLCNRVAVIDKGHLVAAGTPEELKASVGENVVTLRLSKGANADFIRLLQSKGWIKEVKDSGDSIELSMKNREASVPEIVRLAQSNGFVISSINSHKPSLNDVLLHYTGKENGTGQGMDNVISQHRSRRRKEEAVWQTAENVIEVNDLTKKFGDFTAVDHISFTVKEGEIFGFLGPNGAGKSTTIKMLTTLLHPTAGSAKICGYDVVKEQDDVRASMGIVFQDRSSDRFLTGRQNLDFHARMYSMSREEREKKIDEVLELLELKGREDIELNNLPEGVRRRFEVARGFMTYPKVVFLDEPTIGFDIKARMDLWDQIRKAKEKEGVTVVLTTHYIEEADYLCDRVAIIDHAKIVAIDTPEKLKEAVGTDLISLQIANNTNGNFMNKVKELGWVISAEEAGNSVLLNVESGEGRVHELIDFADRNGFVISSVDEHEPSLEDVFVHFTGKTIRDAEGSAKEKRAMMRRKR